MAIIYQFPTALIGSTGIIPNPKYMCVGDDLATVTTAGYLNQGSLQGFPLSNDDIISTLYSYNPVSKVGTYTVFSVSISGTGVITLIEDLSEGNVVLPTIASRIATYVDTAGKISDDAATAVNGGNIQAGLSGTPGFLASFPTTAASGSMNFLAVNNPGDFVISLRNAPMAQSTVITIPDPGVAAATLMFSEERATALTSEIGVAAGIADQCIVLVQLNDANGIPMTTPQKFEVYATDAVDGIGITATAASTGFSIVVGGVRAETGSITKNLFCVSNAVGAATLNLLATAQTAYRFVLVLDDGIVVSIPAIYG